MSAFLSVRGAVPAILAVRVPCQRSWQCGCRVSDLGSSGAMSAILSVREATPAILTVREVCLAAPVPGGHQAQTGGTIDVCRHVARRGQDDVGDLAWPALGPRQACLYRWGLGAMVSAMARGGCSAVQVSSRSPRISMLPFFVLAVLSVVWSLRAGPQDLIKYLGLAIAPAKIKQIIPMDAQSKANRDVPTHRSQSKECLCVCQSF